MGTGDDPHSRKDERKKKAAGNAVTLVEMIPIATCIMYYWTNMGCYWYLTYKYSVVIWFLRSDAFARSSL